MSFSRYGLDWDDEASDVDIELWCYRNEPPKGLSKFEHMKNAIDLIWNYHGSTSAFAWTPWSEDILRNYCKYNVLALGGGGSSGKSHCMAVCAWIDYLSSPTDTLILITSTTIEGAQTRVYNSIRMFWRKEFPCKMLEKGIIKGVTPYGTYSTGSGIRIIPCNGSGDPKNKFIGIKSPNLRLFLDELSDLPVGVIEAWANLSVNERGSKPKLISASNPCSKLDAFGLISTPKDGWDSIDMEKVTQWETLGGGLYMRLDTTINPRITEGRDDWTFYPSKERVEQSKAQYGEDSAMFKRFYRGIFSNDLEEGSLISYKEIEEARAEVHPIWGESPLELYASCDPSYTIGGDKSMLTIAKVGLNVEGRFVVDIIQSIHLKSQSGANEGESQSRLIVRRIKEELARYKIPASRLIIDITGGVPLADLLREEIGTGFVTYSFAGKASTDMVPLTNKRACDLYSDKVTELYYFFKTCLQTKQIYGLTKDACSELTSRKVKTNGSLMKIETKPELKRRIKHSPDLADSIALMLHIVKNQGKGLLGVHGANSSHTTNSDGEIVRPSETTTQSSMQNDWDFIYQTLYV